jgi:hypothetical protein
MPFGQSNFFPSSSGGFGGLGDIFEKAIDIAGQIFAPAQTTQPFPLPGGLQPRQAPRQEPTSIEAIARTGLGELISGQEIGLAQSGCTTTPFGAGSPRQNVTATRFVQANPATGKPTWFGPLGTPILFSGDLAACKRVDRVAKRLAKARPRRPR